MPSLFERGSPAASPEGAELPYRLEHLDSAGETSLIATAHSASLGFACYYAALREYSDGRLTLSCSGRTLATFRAG